MVYRLGIIGGGNMGSAIVRGGIQAGIFNATQLIVAEIDPQRRSELGELGCTVTGNPQDATEAEQILLAVKPQVFSAVALAISPLGNSKIVISIMAGLSSPLISKKLGGEARVVRVMPNTPCQIGAGMAAIALGEGAKPGDESLAVSVFESLGKTVMVDESLMYAVTAVSGSGPAYTFLLAESMQKAAVEVGLDENTARILVEQTVMGAGKLLAESDQDSATLRHAVTSPGGTTAAALDVFKKEGFAEIVVKAIAAARDRGKELDQ